MMAPIMTDHREMIRSADKESVMTIRTPRRPEDWLGDAETEQLTAWLDEMRAKQRGGRSVGEHHRGGSDDATKPRENARAEIENSVICGRDGPRR